LSFGAQHPVRAGLIAAGYTTPYDLAMITEADLDMITYEKKDDTSTVINVAAALLPAHRGMIRMFSRFLRAKQNVKGEILSEAEILALTNKKIDFYRIMDKFEPDPNNTNNTINNTNTSGNVFNEADAFIKGVKRDCTHYPIIKDDCEYETWIIEFIGVARTHLLHEIYDEKYTVPDASTDPDGAKAFQYK
jgi:hypothetical protein